MLDPQGWPRPTALLVSAPPRIKGVIPVKRLWFFAGAAVLALSAASVWAGGLCCGGHCHCIQPPEQNCDYSDPCCHFRMGCPCGPEHAQKFIDTLCNSCECCERIKAAKKLGCRLHADFCQCPEVLNALVKALTCDTCWEVRKTAAWSIAYQGARVPLGVAALYIAAKADRNFLVRDAATDALDILIVCRRGCYKDLFRAADVLIARIRPDYNPTNGNCVNLVMNFCEHADGGPVIDGQVPPMAMPATSPEPIAAPKGPEQVAPPKEEKKEEEKKEEKKDEEKKDEKKDQ
jgi:hypothetical protein